VAFWSNAGTNVYNLWKMDINGTQRLRLTENPTDLLPATAQNLYLNNAPAWSPDGKHICYSMSGDLWETDSEGYNPRTLLSGRDAYSPAYAPKDASVIFVSAGDGPVNNLYRLNLSDYTVVKLTNYSDWNVGSPSYSADGSKILFVLYRENVSQIYTMAADGTNPANLTTDNVSLCPKYAQADTKIVFCAPGEDSTLNVYMMTAAGTDKKLMTSLGGTSPSWAAYIPVAPLPTQVNP
jgi:Tol biopolymer transport system component